MRTRLILWGIVSAALTAFSAEETNLPRATAAAPPPPTADAPTPPPATQVPQTLTERLKAAHIPPAVRDVVQLFEAGTDSAVIQSYVENSATPSNVRAEDVIYLHERGVPNSLITALLQRAAKLREQAPPPASTAPIGPAATQSAPQTPPQTIVVGSPAPAPSQVYVVPTRSPTYVYPSYSSYLYGYPTYGYGYYSAYPRYCGPSVFYSRSAYGYGHAYRGSSRHPGSHGLAHPRHWR